MGFDFVKKGTGGGNVLIENKLYFQTNANTVFPKGLIIFLSEDTNFYKVTDGVSQLKDLRWYKNIGNRQVEEHLYDTLSMAVWNYDSVLGLDYVYAENGYNLVFNTRNYNSSDDTKFYAKFVVMSEPLTLDYISFYVVSNNINNVTITFGIYVPDFTTKTANLFTTVPVTVPNGFTGYIRNTSPLNLFLKSGLYLIGYKLSIAGGGTLRIITTNLNQIVVSNNLTFANNMASGVYFNAPVTSPPLSIPFPNLVASSGENQVITKHLYGTRYIKGL